VKNSVSFRPSSNVLVQQSVISHGGDAVFLTSDGNLACQFLKQATQTEASVMLLRGVASAVEFCPEQWIVGTKLGDLIAFGTGNGSIDLLCKVSCATYSAHN
jgi:hypothetical protein